MVRHTINVFLIIAIIAAVVVAAQTADQTSSTSSTSSSDVSLLPPPSPSPAPGALPFDCSWTAPDGTFYDLSSLKRTADYYGLEGIYGYTLNVCGTSNANGCGVKEAATCQMDKQTGSATFAFGFYGTTPQPTWAQINTADPRAGVQMTFSNGERCGGISAKDRIVTVKYGCTSTTDSGITITSTAAACTYTYILNSPAGCPTTKGGSKGGLSGGSVFLIILLVGTTLYITIGCVYKSRQLGTSGVENCPNIAFWKTIPGLVVDGCRYTKTKINKAMNKGGDSYQQV